MSQSLTAKELKSLKNTRGYKMNAKREEKMYAEENKQLIIKHAQSTRRINEWSAQNTADVKAMEANGITLEVLIAYRDKLRQSKVA